MVSWAETRPAGKRPRARAQSDFVIRGVSTRLAGRTSPHFKPEGICSTQFGREKGGGFSGCGLVWESGKRKVSLGKAVLPGRKEHKKTRSPKDGGLGDSVLSQLASLTHLFDDAGNGLGGLCTVAKPFVGLFKVEGVVFSVDHGIVGAKLLDITPVTASAAVNSNDLEVGAILGTLASESESYHNLGGGRGS